MISPRVRWAVPAVVATAVAGSVLAGTIAAGADPSDLPPRTAAELLADLGAPTTDALSGTVELTSELGLPALPGAAGDLGPASRLSGTNTLRVWADGPERTRVALQDDLAEYDVVRNGAQLSTWSSESREATTLTLPSSEVPSPPPVGLPATPAQAATAALAAIEPSTEVSVQDAVTVADRPARQLVLTPRSEDTLVGSVRLAVDAETNVPLRVQVFATGSSEPALEVGFTDVSFSTPDADVFAFTPPAEADVRELDLPDRLGTPATPPANPRPGALPTVTGSGWATVLTFDGPGSGLGAEQEAQLQQLSTAVPEGRVLSTALVSILVTDDGRLLMGAVPAGVLQAAA